MLLALSSNQKLGLALVAGAFVVFALVSAMVIPRSNPDFPGRRLNLFIGVSVAFTVAMLLSVYFLARESEEGGHAAATETHATETEPAPEPAPDPAPPVETTETTTTEEATTTTTETDAAAGGSTPQGKEIFIANCSGCHTLDDAGTDGSVGPNLDASSPSQDKVVERVTEGKGVMQSFEGILTEEEIQEVAAYVSAVAGQ